MSNFSRISSIFFFKSRFLSRKNSSLVEMSSASERSSMIASFCGRIFSSWTEVSARSMRTCSNPSTLEFNSASRLLNPSIWVAIRARSTSIFFSNWFFSVSKTVFLLRPSSRRWSSDRARSSDECLSWISGAFFKASSYATTWDSLRSNCLLTSSLTCREFPSLTFKSSRSDLWAWSVVTERSVLLTSLRCVFSSNSKSLPAALISNKSFSTRGLSNISCWYTDILVSMESISLFIDRACCFARSSNSS